MTKALTKEFYPLNRCCMQVLAEPRDLWVGVYWTHQKSAAVVAWEWLHVYICPLPMLVLHLWWPVEAIP